MTGFFEILNQSLGQEEKKEKPKEKTGFFEQLNPEGPSLEEKGIDVAKQVGLGLLEKFTYPLDILKSLTHAAGSREIGKIEDPEARSKAEDTMNEFYDYFPTQELAEKFVTKNTGIQFQPQTEEGKRARTLSRLFSLQPGKLLSGSAKQLAKKSAGAAIGTGGKEALQAIGVPDPIAELGGAAISGAISGGKTVLSPLSTASKEAEQVATKHGLPKFIGMQNEKKPFVTPVVSKEKEQALRGKLGESSEKAINDVIDQKIPIKKLRDQGMNLEDAYTKAYDKTEAAAKKFDASGKKINIDPVLRHIDSEISSIKASAPSLSNSDKIRIAILEKEKKALSGKAPTAIQLRNQYQKFNDNTKGIYRKPEYSGSEEAIIDTYGNLNKKIIESMERASPELASEFKTANKIYTADKQIKQVENILDAAFSEGYNSSKLNKILNSNRNRKFLEKNIGKDGIKDLEDIGKYGERAEKQLFERLKNPKTLGEIFSNLTPFKLLLLTGKSSLKGTVGLPVYLTKGISQYVKGYLFTREGTRKSYINYLKAVASNQPSLIRSASKILDNSISSEFGSEEELLKLAEDSSEEK